MKPNSVTVEDHLAFQKSLCKPIEIDELWKDHVAADPIHDHAPDTRYHGKIRRVLDLLDNIEQGGNY